MTQAHRANGRSVLVLSRHYEAIRYVSVERAAALLFTDHAERATESSVATLRSISTSMDIPYAIRVRSEIPKRYREIPLTRKNLLERDNHTCQYCGQTGGRLTIDHIVPSSRGGENIWTNVVAACWNCNNFKDARTPIEAGMVLKTKPRQPSRQSFMLRGVNPDDIHPELQPYLFVHRHVATYE